MSPNRAISAHASALRRTGSLFAPKQTRHGSAAPAHDHSLRAAFEQVLLADAHNRMSREHHGLKIIDQ